MKKILNQAVYFCVLLSSFIFWHEAMGGESFIPLKKGLRMASDDLIYNNQILSSRDADLLGNNQQVDLAKLEPVSNDLWENSANSLDDQKEIAINDDDTLNYEGSILSNTGLFRFNAIPTDGNKVYTIHLDKTLHTMLMRKNLLRALGYKIPAMKYLKRVRISFNSKIALDNFLKREIPEATLGASERWAISDLVSADQLSVTLKDVAITEPNEYDFYNVSMGVPTQTINSRTLRALVIPYALVDLYESVNKYSWVAGKVDNQAVILSHFTGNDFATTVDDALWMLNKLNKLSREDYEQIVGQAYFPKEIQIVLVEKLIARRNSLNRLFSVKAKEMAYNSKISVEPAVKDGKIIQKEYPDYASRFAYGDAQSPLDQLRFFLYSKMQSNVIDNLINRINSEMVGYDASTARTEYFQKQFKEGLDHFVQTGEMLPIKVGTWVSPVVTGTLLLSRDIILGNYLGTDNMVQLADTFGASANLGVLVGVEGFGYGLAGSVRATTSLVRSYSHIKPVKNLRESLKEPYRNIFVGLLKRSLREKFFSLSELKKIGEKDGENGSSKKDEQQKLIEEIFVEIDKKLDVGESLIITDRLVPTAGVSLNFNQGLVGAGVGVSGGVTVLKRIHLYRKSPKILQIYDDSGFVKNVELSFDISSLIPVLRVNGAYDKGNYNVKSYMVNLSTDLSENPGLFLNALGVYNVLKDKDFEILGSNNPPVSVDVQFKDKTKALSLLFWRMESETGKTYYDIKAKDGVAGRYFSLEKDFMTGLNPEAFTKQMMNYYLAKAEVENVQITEDGEADPGESFFGRSRSQKLRFEASLDENKKFGQKFLSLSDIKQGWGMSEKKVRKFMKKVNEKFQYNLFDPDLVDFKKLRLYEIGYHLSLYNRGLERLSQIKVEEINPIETRYKKEKDCHYSDQKFETVECGDLRWLKTRIKKCQKSKNEEAKAECSVELFTKMMDDLEFKDFKQLIGENNLYIYGSIDGFREKSEILNDTIYSNTIGKIGSKQWDGPLDVVRELLGLSGGEFSGEWIR